MSSVHISRTYDMGKEKLLKWCYEFNVQVQCFNKQPLLEQGRNYFHRFYLLFLFWLLVLRRTLFPTFFTQSFSLTSAGWKRNIERTLGTLAYCLFVIKLRTIDLRYLFIFVLSVSFLDDSATPNLLSVSFWKMYWILIFQWDDEDLGEIPWTYTILYIHGIANIYFELDSVYIVLICWVKER